MEITKDMYRLALHIYLTHAYPDDDGSYYTKWSYLANGRWWTAGLDGGIPEETRFGCHVSGNTKLRATPSGKFMFDTNHHGDPEDVVAEVKRLKKAIEDEWHRLGLPVSGYEEDGGSD